MGHVFFDSQLQRKLDSLSFNMLQIVLSRSALESLAHHGFHFQKPIQSAHYHGAIGWLDDTVFGKNRIKFYSQTIQASYDVLVKCCSDLWHEIVTAYSGGEEGGLVLNFMSMTNEQRSALQNKLDCAAKQTFAAAGNLWTVALAELP